MGRLFVQIFFAMLETKFAAVAITSGFGNLLTAIDDTGSSRERGGTAQKLVNDLWMSQRQKMPTASYDKVGASTPDRNSMVSVSVYLKYANVAHIATRLPTQNSPTGPPQERRVWMRQTPKPTNCALCTDFHPQDAERFLICVLHLIPLSQVSCRNHINRRPIGRDSRKHLRFSAGESCDRYNYGLCSRNRPNS